MATICANVPEWMVLKPSRYASHLKPSFCTSRTIVGADTPAALASIVMEPRADIGKCDRI